MSDEHFPREGRLLGIDAGDRRVGVAVSDEMQRIASPAGMIERGPGEMEAFRAKVQAYEVAGIVAGLPTGMSGREGPQAMAARAYAEGLAAALGLPLRFWDERLTTAVAERALVASGRSRKQRKGEIDAVAAAVMLQGYLDAGRRPRSGK
jgi:putative holliday junction resolvase